MSGIQKNYRVVRNGEIRSSHTRFSVAQRRCLVDDKVEVCEGGSWRFLWLRSRLAAEKPPKRGVVNFRCKSSLLVRAAKLQCPKDVALSDLHRRVFEAGLAALEGQDSTC